MRRFALFPLMLLLFPLFAMAHVGYVTTADEMATIGGSDWEFFVAPLSEPVNLFLIAVTIVLAPLLFVFLRRLQGVRSIMSRIQQNAHRYEPLISWMLRLSLGIGLIGAGVANAIISPAIAGTGWISTLQIALGFLIMSGFLIAPAVIGALGVYAIALIHTGYAFGNFDVFMIGLSILVLGNGMPGVDDLFGIRLFPRFAGLRPYVPFFLRLGIGSAMSFLAIYEKFLNPQLSALVVQRYELSSVIPVSVEMWVLSAGLIELAVGLALLFGVLTRLTVAIAFIVLSLSFFYFGEGVYSHITLFGTLSVLFVTGGGVWSIDHWWETRKKAEK